MIGVLVNPVNIVAQMLSIVKSLWLRYNKIIE